MKETSGLLDMEAERSGAPFEVERDIRYSDGRRWCKKVLSLKECGEIALFLHEGVPNTEREVSWTAPSGVTITFSLANEEHARELFATLSRIIGWGVYLDKE